MIGLLIVGMGLISFLLRSSFILWLSGREFPKGVQAALVLVPAAVLSSLVWPDVFTRAGHLELHLDKLLSSALATFVAWKTRNVLYTVVVGMAALWGLRALGLT